MGLQIIVIADAGGDEMEENHILSVLKRSHEESLMVSVYSDRNEPEGFSAGFIDSLSAEQFVLKHVTPEDPGRLYHQKNRGCIQSGCGR